MPGTFAPVLPYLVQATIAQQLIDRGVFGMALDEFIARQVARETATSQNKDLLSGVLNDSNLGTMTGAGTTLYKVGDELRQLIHSVRLAGIEHLDIRLEAAAASLAELANDPLRSPPPVAVASG